MVTRILAGILLAALVYGLYWLPSLTWKKKSLKRRSYVWTVLGLIALFCFAAMLALPVFLADDTAQSSGEIVLNAYFITAIIMLPLGVYMARRQNKGIKPLAEGEAPAHEAGGKRKVGCLKTFLMTGLAVLLVMGWALWQAGEPGRRAREVHDAITPGMSLTEVEKLPTGRVLRAYSVETDGAWETVAPKAFMNALSAHTDPGEVAGRLNLTFMGSSPGRFSFEVEFDRTGKVVGVSKPYNWD